MGEARAVKALRVRGRWARLGRRARGQMADWPAGEHRGTAGDAGRRKQEGPWVCRCAAVTARRESN